MLEDIFPIYGFDYIESLNISSALDIASRHLGIEESDNIDQKLISFNHFLQKYFLRKKGTEREEFEDKFSDPEIRSSLTPLLKLFTSPVEEGNNVLIKLLLSAPEDEVKKRFQILDDLEKKGFHADIIFLVTGERALWFDEEPIAKTMVIKKLVEDRKIPQFQAADEVEKAYVKFSESEDSIYIKRDKIKNYFAEIWPTEAQMLLEIVKNFPSFNEKVLLINTPNNFDEKGQIIRPNTYDGYLKLWQNYGDKFNADSINYPNNKIPMSIVTTQPYAIYQQQSAISAFQGKPIDISTVATVIENPNISVIFDSLARIIYVGLDSAKLKIKAMERGYDEL